MNPEDAELEKAKLEAEKAGLVQWLDAAPTKAFLSSITADKDEMVDLLCNRSVTNLETLVAHFEVVGYIRALRSIALRVPNAIEEYDTQITTIDNQ